MLNFIFARINNVSLEGPLTNTANGSTTAGSTAIPVFIDENPFLNNQALGVLNDLEAQGAEFADIDGSRAVFLSRELSDVTGPIFSGNQQDTYRTSTVVEGEFNMFNRDWFWDVGFIYGRTTSDNFDTNILDVEFALATDVVADANGNPVCRQQTLAAPEAIDVRNPGLTFINTGLDSLVPTQAQVDACVPLNLFGFGNVSPEAADFVTAGSDSFNTSQQFVGNASLQGAIIDLPAGPLQFVGQFEWRREENEFEPGPVFGQGLARNTLGQGSQGVLTFFEGGGEVNVPVFDDGFNFFGMERLEITGAVRAVSRDISSDTNPLANDSDRVTDLTFTAGGNWQPVPGVTIRGSRARAVRSPSVVELAGAGVTGFTGGGDSDFACDADNINGGPNPAVRAANCATAFAILGISDLLDGFQIPGGTARPAAGSSNPFLDNEVADNWTVGIVIQPEFLPGLTIEADWLSVDLENEIALSFQVNTCFDDPAFPNTTVGGFPACDLSFFNVPAGGEFAPNADPSLGFVVPETNPITGAPVPAVAQPGSPSPQQAAGNLAFVFFPTINVGAQELRALNTRIAYEFDLDDYAPGFGTFRLDGRVFFLQRRTLAPTGDFEVFSNEEAGETGDPRFTSRLDFIHRIGNFTHNLRWIRTQSTIGDVENETPESELAFDFRVPTTNLFSYTAGYQFTDYLEGRLIVDNLTNERTFQVTDGLGFDPLGRRFTFVLEASF